MSNPNGLFRYHRNGWSQRRRGEYDQELGCDGYLLSFVSNIPSALFRRKRSPHSVSTRKKIHTHLLSTSSTSIVKMPPSRSLKWSRCGDSFRLHVHLSRASMTMAA